MYAARPTRIAKLAKGVRSLQKKKRRRALDVVRGGPPKSVVRQNLERRRLLAYQLGAYDNVLEGAAYDLQQDQFAALDESLSRSGVLYDDAEYAGGLGLKIKLKLPKFIRKMKPLKVLGKAAKIAAPIVGVATGGILAPALIGAGGSILQKGRKAKLFKDVVGSAAVGAAGGVARRVAPTVFRGARGLVRGIGRTGSRVAGLLKSGTPSVPGAPDVPSVELPPELQVPQTVEQVAASVGLPSPTPTYAPPATYTPPPMYAPTEEAASETPPGEPVPGETPSGTPPATDMKKLLVPGLIAAALLL